MKIQTQKCQGIQGGSSRFEDSQVDVLSLVRFKLMC